MNAIEHDETEREHIAIAFRTIYWFSLWLVEDMLGPIASKARVTCLWLHVCTGTGYTCLTGA